MNNHFPAHDEDQAFISMVSSVVVNPVFIMGAHRSGTTFIYDSVAKCFPLANVDLYHIFFYERLLANFFQGKEESDRRWFNRYIQHLGITDRGLDSIQVTDRMVEEYCWILGKKNKLFPATLTKPKDLPRLKELCQKVSYCTQSAQGVLLKNPFDFSNAEQLLAYFPNAKFIFVRRRPSEILNSSLRAYIKMSRPHPFFSLMKTTQPPLTRFVLGKIEKWIYRMSEQQLLDKISGSVQKSLKNDLIKAKRSLSVLPSHSYTVVDYDDFNDNPAAVLDNIKATIDMDFSFSPALIKSNKRQVKLLEETKKYAQEIDLYTL